MNQGSGPGLRIAIHVDLIAMVVVLAWAALLLLLLIGMPAFITCPRSPQSRPPLAEGHQGTASRRGMKTIDQLGQLYRSHCQDPPGRYGSRLPPGRLPHTARSIDPQISCRQRSARSAKAQCGSWQPQGGTVARITWDRAGGCRDGRSAP
jgi:hypothetical protein